MFINVQAKIISRMMFVIKYNTGYHIAHVGICVISVMKIFVIIVRYLVWIHKVIAPAEDSHDFGHPAEIRIKKAVIYIFLQQNITIRRRIDYNRGVLVLTFNFFQYRHILVAICIMREPLFFIIVKIQAYNFVEYLGRISGVNFNIVSCIIVCGNLEIIPEILH